MKSRILGKTAWSISEIGLGCWQLGNDFGPIEDKQALAVLDAAKEQGISFFDTADVYGAGLSEERIGRWLKQSSWQPKIATKVGRNGELYPDGYTKVKMKQSLQASAKRLGVETLNLAQLHCVPREVLFAGDVLAWMEDFQQEGLIEYFGASVEMIDEALFCCQHDKLASLQVLFNLFRQDAVDELFPLVSEKNIGVIVRLPLASGLLTGKMFKGYQFDESDHRHYNKDGVAFHVGETFNGIPFDQGIDLVEEVSAMLPEDHSILDVALRWILDQPQVSTIIAGATRPEQVIRNAQASLLEPLSTELHHKLKTFYLQKVRQAIRGGI
ncbi:aldo/keto reductase [Marinomonas sp. THO17]|uniref:aldo/keto reductase n=1 Tax=Marinomonas sp. THO17 TaxID=3149048 RepID=UPI00336C2790